MMADSKKIITLTAIGLDSPGLVSQITTKIFKLKGNVIDVEENCRRGLFSIFLIIDFADAENSIDEICDVLKGIEPETGLKIIFGAYNEDDITYLAEKEHHIVTILGIDQPGIIARVSTFFHQWNINIEKCRMIARGKFFSMEMVIDTSQINGDPAVSHIEAIEKMKGHLRQLCTEIHQSVVIQSEQIYKRIKKLIVFDVESSLIQHDSLRNFLGQINGKVKSMDRHIEFNNHNEDEIEGLIENARVLKGIPISDLELCSKLLRLNPGTIELIHILKSMGFKIALLSSGFNFFVKEIFESAGVDYAFSNTLGVDPDGTITGELEEPIINSTSKNEILDFIMNVEKIEADQVIAVGDGSTRSHYIKNVGLSIAFNPDETDIQADGILSGHQIINMLYCLGIPKTELELHNKKAFKAE